jgi:hypothetical protein
MAIWKLVMSVLSIWCCAAACHTVTPAVTLGTAATNEIVTIDQLWPEVKLLGMPVQTLHDSKYRTLTEAEIPLYFSAPTEPWQFDRFDCDDTALTAHVEALRRHRQRDSRLVGLAVGVIGFLQADSAHEANVVRLRDGRWLVLDVRTMKLSSLPSRNKILLFFL